MNFQIRRIWAIGTCNGRLEEKYKAVNKTLNGYKHAKIKQYHKEGRALRTGLSQIVSSTTLRYASPHSFREDHSGPLNNGVETVKRAT